MLLNEFMRFEATALTTIAKKTFTLVYLLQEAYLLHAM